jgi:hypothetical protein
MGAEGGPAISHALARPVPVVHTAASPQAGAAGAVVADPTHLLTSMSLAEIEALLAHAPAQAAATAPSPPAATAPSRRQPSPWAWAWAIWEAAAALYVALTEPERRRAQSRASQPS